jgi:hypothetical protein
MAKTLFTYNPTLMSPRTKEYFEAMILEGRDFDYDRWLKKIRDEEAKAKQVEAKGTSGEAAVAAISELPSTPDDQRVRSNPLFLTGKTIRLKARRPHQEILCQTPKARLRRWLEKVSRACERFQSSRNRDAVYDYLEIVFAIVTHYRVRQRTNRLLRHAFEFAHLPFDKNADPFSAVIRCTSGNAADTKMISKWSRALRCVARYKKTDTGLREFMKRLGGVNACADQYARIMRHR